MELVDNTFFIILNIAPMEYLSMTELCGLKIKKKEVAILKVKTILASVVSATLIFGGSVYAINYTANEEPLQEMTEVYNTQEEVIAPPLLTQSKPIQIIDQHQLKNGIDLPLDLVGNNAAIQTASEQFVTSLKEVKAMDNQGVEEVMVIYQLADGAHELILFQTENTYGSVEETINLTLDLYNPEDTRVEEINGHKAVIEDNENRKHVHLITENQFYTVGSPGGTVSLSDLIEVASKINAE